MNEPATGPSDDAEILFPEGIIGVPRAKRFHLLERPDSPIRFLDSLDIKGFRLPVVDPFLVDSGYAPRLGARISEVLKVGDADAVVMLVIANMAGSAEGAVANLRAPLIINVNRRCGIQVILDDSRYGLRIPLQLEAQAVGR